MDEARPVPGSWPLVYDPHVKTALYLDHHATTPVDPRVRDAMVPWLSELFGNPGSRTHPFGWQANEAVERAREQVAAMIGARPSEIVFTAGATESNNLAIAGSAAGRAGGRVVTMAIEHHAVLDPCLRLRDQGFDVVVLPVDAAGRVDPADVARALSDSTFLVAVMAANNEIGTIQPLEEIGRACRERSVPLHVDAAQAPGRMPLDVEAWGASTLALSGHKFGAPQGVGALYVRSSRPRARLTPLTLGGGQEGGLRPGTLNVPGIVGLGVASRCAVEALAAGVPGLVAARRDRMQARLVAAGGAHVHGASDRLCANLSIRFDGVEAEELLLALPGLALSTGSACSTGDSKPSHVLTAIGLSRDQARGTVRIGLGAGTTDGEVDDATEQILAAVAEIRQVRAPGARNA